MKKRLLAAFCAAVVLFGLFAGLSGPAQADWDDGLMLIAINDQLLPLSADVMPITVGGTVYVPYTLFDAKLNGGYNVGNIYSGGQKVVEGKLRDRSHVLIGIDQDGNYECTVEEPLELDAMPLDDLLTEGDK